MPEASWYGRLLADEPVLALLAVAQVGAMDDADLNTACKAEWLRSGLDEAEWDEVQDDLTSVADWRAVRDGDADYAVVWERHNHGTGIRYPVGITVAEYAEIERVGWAQQARSTVRRAVERAKAEGRWVGAA